MIEKFVAPILEVFNGGQAITQEQRKTLTRVYALAVMGFEPEAYEIACTKMMISREDPFRPTPAECRKTIEKAHDALPQVIAEKRLNEARAATADMLKKHPKHADIRAMRALPREEQFELWPRALRHLADCEVCSNDEPSGADLVWRIIRWWRIESLLSPPCIIPTEILVEFGLPTTASEIAAAKEAQQRLSKIFEHQLAEAKREQKARERAAFSATWERPAFIRFDALHRKRRSWRMPMMVPGPKKWERDHYGPAPGEAGSFVPPELQAEHGYTAHESTIAYWKARDAAGDGFADDPRFTDPMDPIDCRTVLKRLRSPAPVKPEEPARSTGFAHEQIDQLLEKLTAPPAYHG